MQIDSREIKMIAVESTNIESIGYDSENSKLIVKFLSNGHVYAYDNVSATQHIAIMSAESHGKFLAKHIKPNHPATRIR